MSAELYCPETFGDTLARVISSSRMAQAARVCLLATRDRDHAMHVVKEAVSQLDRPLFHFTVAGRYRYDPKALAWTVVSAESADAPALLMHAQELKNGGVVMLEDCLAGLDDRNGNQRMRMLLARLLSAETNVDGLVLVFLEPPAAETHLPSILADQFVRLDVPYPRAHELEAIARQEVAAARWLAEGQADAVEVGRSGPRLASGLVGLTRSAARDALRDARETEKFSGADLHSAVKQAAAQAEDGSQELTLELLRAEMARKRPRALAVYDEFHELRRWGRNFCDPAGPSD